MHASSRLRIRSLVSIVALLLLNGCAAAQKVLVAVGVASAQATAKEIARQISAVDIVGALIYGGVATVLAAIGWKVVE